MVLEPGSSITMRTNHAISSFTLERTHQYAVGRCTKCHTGTLELFFDTRFNDHYASCLNCGMEFYKRTPRRIPETGAPAPSATM